MQTEKKTYKKYDTYENMTSIIKYVKKFSPLRKTELVSYVARTVEAASRQAASAIVNRLIRDGYLVIDERSFIEYKKKHVIKL